VDRDRDRRGGDTGTPRPGASVGPGLDDLELPDLSRPAPSGAGGASATEAIADEAGLLGSTLGRDDRASRTDVPRVSRLDYGRHLKVLLVDADDEQADALSRAAEESVLDIHVERVASIDATLTRLERASGAILRKPLPDVIVVALPTPETHQLLEILQLDDRFDEMPIIVLNEAADPAAERRAFALGATAHLVTPRRDYERVALMHALPDFIPRARAVHAHLESHRR
jgi:CheY-like chemotaxis protein